MRFSQGVWYVSLAVVLTMALIGAAWAGEFQVDLNVREPAGAARKAAPASGGIPLPEGLFRKGREFAVFAGGKEVPAQVLPLVIDEKGYLRWILVDVQTDVAADGTATLTLKAAKPLATVTNWWLAANLNGEPAPAASGTRERFDVTGLPAGAKYFAVRSFDDASNRSAVSNVAEVR